MRHFIVLTVLIGCLFINACQGKTGDNIPEGAVPLEGELHPIPSVQVTNAPGNFPSTDNLPEFEDSSVGEVITVDCNELDNSIFRCVRQDDGKIIIVKISAPKDDSLTELPIATVYSSVDTVGSEDIGSSLSSGVECKVVDQRYIHGYAWTYCTTGIWALTHPNYSTEKLSDTSCYGYIKPGEALTEGENFFYDCEASRDGIESVFKRIIEHYGVSGSVMFNIPKSTVQPAGMYINSRRYALFSSVVKKPSPKLLSACDLPSEYVIRFD